MSNSIRNLVVVLGDQLDLDSAAFNEFDPQVDRVWMAEVTEESEHVWSHKARIALFLSAMRHFRQELADVGCSLIYHQLAQHPYRSLSQALAADVEKLRPNGIVMVQAGDYRVQHSIASATHQAGIALDIRADSHFLCSIEEFETWAGARKQLRLENFYREMRTRLGILVDGKQPVGGEWNYDKANRQTFGKKGPGMLPMWPSFHPDSITKGVIKEVTGEFHEHPGSLASFDWPVTRADAKLALQDFVAHRLSSFGAYQDALWTGQPFLYHSGLASAMNLKLLSPAEVIEAAVQAFHRGEAPINSVEGFVRQILGWREYVRGIYWREMPDYLTRNALGSRQPLPNFYWTGDTHMVCLRNAIGQTLEYGYAHHIQRLMITGLFALLLAVEPRRLHEWYLAVYVDAVEWVEAPNTLGMSQYADGGLLASKPYVATGKYIKRMSNYCANCRFNPDKATGDDACPFTTLYWDFLQRHESRFARHPRTALQWKNLARLSEADRKAITAQATRIRHQYEG
jgi:deoxyribodipyrimidine photolyase-related protein